MPTDTTARSKVIFERICFFLIPAALYHIIKGDEVFVFDFSGTIKKSIILRWLINKGKIRRIFRKRITPLSGLAIDETEKVYGDIRNTIPGIMAKLFKDQDTDLAFKKILVMEVFECMYINEELHDEQKKRDPLSQLYFVPYEYERYANLLHRHSNFNLRPLNRVRFLHIYKPLVQISRLASNIFWYCVIGLYLIPTVLLLYIMSAKKRRNPEPKVFKYGISISQPFQTKFKGGRSFDFLLDGEGINRENSLFIFDHYGDKSAIMENGKKAYCYYDIRETLSIKGIWSARCEAGELKDTFLALVKVLFSGSRERPFLMGFTRGIHIFLRWHIFLQRFSIQNYIYANQEFFIQTFVNLLLKRHGTTTWNYPIYIGGGILYTKDREYEKVRQLAWAYLMSDYSLTYNALVSKYFENHLQKVNTYVDIGCLYSEIEREVGKGVERQNFVRESFGMDMAEQYKLVVAFDTSFVDFENAVTTFDDCIHFYQDLSKLLKDNGDLLMIIKPSKGDSYFVSPESHWSSPVKGKKILEQWASLRAHPRVFWAGDSGDPPTLMAVSDMVITHCMSSPTAEALGARRKALWYESGNKHRDLMYDQIPGLICHGYRELAERVHQLFYEISDEEYEDFLDKFVKGNIDTYLDGLALTRFRQLLKGRI